MQQLQQPEPAQVPAAQPAVSAAATAGSAVLEVAKWAFQDSSAAANLLQAAAQKVAPDGLSLDSLKAGLMQVASLASADLPSLAVKATERLAGDTAAAPGVPPAPLSVDVTSVLGKSNQDQGPHSLAALQVPQSRSFVALTSSQFTAAAAKTAARSTACEMDCNGNGICSAAGTCQCNAGWQGVFCDIPRCESDCGGNGLCIKGKCVCNEGWYGASCSHKRCPDDCSGAGFCFEGKCQCISGYQGENCAELHVVGQTLAVKLRQENAADPRPGLNRFLQVASLRPVQGPQCPDDCNGRGMCTAAGHCRCNVGYSGAACQTFCPNECSRQGQCIEGGCLCFAGFSGVDCSVKGCCSGHGTCDTPDTCVCDAGWGGTECSQHLVCEDPTCSGNGQCVQGVCECKPGFRGSTCSIAVAECEQCSENGVCNPATKTCECKPGFTGADCTVRLLTCKNNCNGRGLCLNGHCMCGSGWTGEDCARRNFAMDSIPSDFSLPGVDAGDFGLNGASDPIAALDAALGPEPRIGLDMRPVPEPSGGGAPAASA